LSLWVALAALAACSGKHGNPVTPPTSGAPPSAASTGAPDTASAVTGSPHSPRFASQRWGFTINYPVDSQVQPDFRHSYLQTGTWKAYAAPDSHGLPVVALVMPGSDQITDAEVRIGASDSRTDVARCTTPPQAVRAGSVGKVVINGIPFTHFEAGDAAMSHYLDVHGYRVVHAGTCYAIDLLVYGTNPAVYSPPATPPFTRAQAFAWMRAVLDTFRFTQ
jgi:hypothetical protein